MPALVFSWVFEFTPEGLRREVEADREQSITRFTGKKIDRLIVALLVLALSYFAVDKFVLESARVADIVEEATEQARSEALVESYGEQSIAVLPFVNLSADPKQAYFSDGISEEILNLLAQIPELRVISRSSAFSFRGKDVAIPQVAKQLNVAHVLEGSVRKAGDPVRITAQLIDARSDTQLWSQAYDRTLEDVFKVQSEIAVAISDALRMKLAAAGTKLPAAIETVNHEAYDAYLKGRELIHARTGAELAEAIGHLERSISLDSRFAPAHAQLAIATLLYHGYSHEEARRTAERHLARAQELAPDLAEAHAGRALLALLNDPESAIGHAEKALAVNPNYIDAMHWLRDAFSDLDRDEEANALFERMLVTDPLSITVRRSYAGSLMDRGHLKQAHAVADQIIEHSPPAGYAMHARISRWAEGNLSQTLSWALQASARGWIVVDTLISVGEYDEARHISGSSLDRYHSWTYVAEGRWEDAVRASREELRQRPNSAAANADKAHVLVLARRFDEALERYERAVDLSPEGKPILSWGPFYMTHLAFLRSKAGDEVGAQAAIGMVRRSVTERAEENATWLDDMYEAVIAAFDQDPDRAIAALTGAVRQGFRSPYIFDDPLFDDICRDPRFVALRQELDGMLATEREKVLQLICFDNPVPDEWQPLPETCEGVEDHR